MSPMMGLLPGLPAGSHRSRLRRDRHDPAGRPSQTHRNPRTTGPPSALEQTPYPSRPNVRRYENSIRFATIDAVKAGWLIKSKGEWSLSELGREAYTQFSDPEAFQREAQRLYRAWKQTQPPTGADEGEDQPVGG